MRWWWCWLGICCWLGAGAGEVKTTFNAQPFSYEETLLEETPEYRLFRLTYPSPEPPSWPEAAAVTAYFYQPANWQTGDPARPGVLCLHILGGGGELTRMIAANFAANGIPALMPIMPLFGERVPSGGRNAALQGPGGARILGEAFRAIPGEMRRGLDLLAVQPGVNPERLQIMGTSLGGIMAATVAGMDPRVDRAAFLLGGGNFQKLLAHDAKEINPMREAIERGAPADRDFALEAFAYSDPLRYAPNLRDRAAAGKLLMINAGADEVIPLECTRELAGAMGMAEQLQLLEGLGHYTAIAALPQMLDQLVEHFRDASVPVRELAPLNSDQVVIGRIFGELQRLCQFAPAPGRMLRVEADFEVIRPEQAPIRGTLRMARGAGERFALRLTGDNLPFELTRVEFGFDDAPWVQARDGRVFRGSLAPETPVWHTLLDPRLGQYAQLAATITGMAALNGSLGMLEKFVRLELENRAGAPPKIRVIEKKNTAEILLDDQGRTPRAIHFSNADCEVMLQFTVWETDAPAADAAFAAPEAAEQREVEQRTLERVMAAMVNFGLAQGGK